MDMGGQDSIDFKGGGIISRGRANASPSDNRVNAHE